MTQGLLHNVLRHARASRVALGLSAEGGRLTLTVRDDGVGFDGRQEGRGLRIIRQRVEALDGTLAWSRPEAGGTACTITVPIRF
jgi:signal transduction histidine kinase